MQDDGQDDSDDEGNGSWVQALAALVNCGVGTAFSSFDAAESSMPMPPVPPPAEDDTSMMAEIMRCGGGDVGQTYDEVVSPQKPAIPVEALYDEIISLRQQVARMEADGAAPYALQDELDRLRRRLDTADGDIGCPPPPPHDSPLELEVGGRDSAATLSVADRESSAARLSRGGPRPAR